jgi:hypothetical protein
LIDHDATPQNGGRLTGAITVASILLFVGVGSSVLSRIAAHYAAGPPFPIARWSLRWSSTSR